MELYGFARTGVAGEYSPTVVFASSSSDITSTTSFVTLVSTTVTIETVGEVLTLIGSIVSTQDFAGGNPSIRFTIDGAAYSGANNTASVGGSLSNVRRVRMVEGLSPGPHTVTMEWKNTDSS